MKCSSLGQIHFDVFIKMKGFEEDSSETPWISPAVSSSGHHTVGEMYPNRSGFQEELGRPEQGQMGTNFKEEILFGNRE